MRLIHQLLLLCISLVLSGGAALSVAAQEPTPDPRFGLVQTYDDFPAAAETGTGFTRIKFYWDIIQPTGPNDWQPANIPDPLIETDLAAGRQVVGLIVRTPAWARDPNHPGNDPARPDLKDVPRMDAWAAFVERLARQYEGRIQHWVIWNEPDVWDAGHPGSTWNGDETDYAQLLKEAYHAIKDVDPELKVYLTGLTYWWDEAYDREQYLLRLLRVLAADPEAAAHGYYFDGVVYHLYYKPQQVYDILREVRHTLDSYGLQDKAIWLNETNAPPSTDLQEPPHREPDFQVTLSEQSAYIIQVHAMAFGAGAERVQVYKLFNSTEHPEDVQPFGLLRGDKSRRPAFAAYQVVTTYLSGFEQMHLFERGDVYVAVFERPDDTVTVLWNMVATPRQVTVQAIREEATLVDEAGRRDTIAAVGGQYRLTLPPAECSSGECFIGGAPRLIVESGRPIARSPFSVQATPTPPPPTAVDIMRVSPRRRFVFSALLGMAVVLLVVLIWRQFVPPRN